MSDTLSHGARIANDDASPDVLTSTITDSVRALEAASERRGLALDWSKIKVSVGPAWPDGLRVTVSAPVL